MDLSQLNGNYVAQDGDWLTGTLAGDYKISVADGATVTLSGITINGGNDWGTDWAGITCEGDATLVPALPASGAVAQHLSLPLLAAISPSVLLAPSLLTAEIMVPASAEVQVCIWPLAVVVIF